MVSKGFYPFDILWFRVIAIMRMTFFFHYAWESFMKYTMIFFHCKKKRIRNKLDIVFFENRTNNKVFCYTQSIQTKQNCIELQQTSRRFQSVEKKIVSNFHATMLASVFSLPVDEAFF